MNIPMSWLKAYVDIDCGVEQYIEDITMSGSKVECVVNVGGDISGIVVGRVLSIEKHPDADKLLITQIDVGRAEPIQIVTGAQNLTVGDDVPVALDGTTVAGGKKIKSGKLRGVLSDGMLCSIEELGYTREDYPEAPEDGIYVFPRELQAPLGADAKPILEIDEDTVEYEITSNRSDCFSVIGIAREAAATYNKPLRYPEIAVKEQGQGHVGDMISIDIQNPELCPRYAARAVQNVRIEPSPQWMRHRLTAAGLRPINNIVDITNYVMLELGQPLHAFDIDAIAERQIIVRNAREGESFITLDGQERTLDASMLVIADPQKAVAIAGVMGGENSKITEGATTILFESANFNGTNIRLTSKKLGLRTDASAKFEKGIDPNLAAEAVNRAVQLVELLQCGDVVPGLADCYPNRREPVRLAYAPERINKLLGTQISTGEMAALLERVEIKTENGTAVIPTFRPDIGREADLAEEVARLYGYNNINATLATGTPTVGKKNAKQLFEDLVRDNMVAQGLCEALSYAFESPKVFDKLLIPHGAHLRSAVTIANPLGGDFSIMRTTALNAMLQSLSTNYNRRNEEAALFEIAKVYQPKQLPLTELPEETMLLTIGLYGKKDFYDIKGIVENLGDALGLSGCLDFETANNLPFMHPGQTADMKVDGSWIGFVGQVHPAILQNYEIGTKAYLACLMMPTLQAKARLAPVYQPVPRFPAIKRDIAMVVEAQIPVGRIEKAIHERGGRYLESVKLFDVYTGEHVQAGYKSVAYSITFRDAERTLTDEDITAAMSKILKNLEEKLGAQLRDK